jgi:hypothetical protein
MAAFDDFVAKYGEPDDAGRLGEDDLDAIAASVSPQLAGFFRAHGVGAYAGGLFRTVNPLRCGELAEAWNEPRATGSIFVVGAFGCFIYRDGDSNHFVNVWADTRTELFADPADVFDASLCDKGFIDHLLLGPDFRRIAKRLGAPGEGECYGFFPAIALGGDGSPESARKVRLREHLAMLAQL